MSRWSASRGSLSRGGLCTRGSSLFRGRSLSRKGGLFPGGLCPRGPSVQVVSVRVGLFQGDPPYGKEPAVRILQECILVILADNLYKSLNLNQKLKNC